MRQAVVMMTAAVVTVLAVAIPFAVAEDVISVDVAIETYRGDPGDLILVATVETGPGLNCTGGVDPVNNSSEHDNSDVVFVSGNAGGTVFDFEVPTFVGQEIFFVSEGPTLIYVRIGDDGVISAGFVATLDCHEPASTTHVDTPTTLTVPPTTEPPPVGGVPAGGGSMATAPLMGSGPLFVAAGFLLTGAGVLTVVAVRARRSD